MKKTPHYRLHILAGDGKTNPLWRVEEMSADLPRMILWRGYLWGSPARAIQQARERQLRRDDAHARGAVRPYCPWNEP